MPPFKSYSEKLLDPRWQKKRLEILERDQWACQKCSDKKTTLHIHHIKYQKGKEPWDYDETLLVSLCAHCHQAIERHCKTVDFDIIKIQKQENNFGEGFYLFIKYPWDGPCQNIESGNILTLDAAGKIISCMTFDFEELAFFSKALI